MDGNNWILRLTDRFSGAARAVKSAVIGLIGAEEKATAAGAAMQKSMDAAGHSAAAAGNKAAASARGFDKAAASMRKASAAGASFGQLAGRGPGGMLAAGQVGAMPHSARGDVAFAGGRKVLGRSLQSYGPIYNPSAQGAAAGGMGPVLDRKAQGFSVFQKAGHALSDGTRDVVRWNAATGESIDKWQAMSAAFMRTPFGFVLSGLGSVAGVLFDVVGAIGSAIASAAKLGIALGAVAAVSFAKMTVEMGAFADKAKRALGYITGSDALGRREFIETTRLAKDLGLNVEETVGQYSKLRSMQFSATAASGIISLASDIKAVTGDAQSAERAIVAMTQIKAKGKLQSEELVGQLAEAGVSTVLVYKELEKLLNTDRAGVLKQLQGGKVDSDTGLVAITRALKQKYHIDDFGTIGKDFANNTLTGLVDSLKNAPARMFMRIGEELDTQPLIDGLRRFKDYLENAFESGSATRFVQQMVDGFGKLMPAVTAFADGFGSGLDRIAEALSFGDAAGIEDWARGAGSAVAEFFTKTIETAKVVGPALFEALGGLLSGFDVNAFIGSLKSFDWGKFGSDLATIAGALGKIVGATASMIGPAATTTATVAANAVESPVQSALGASSVLLSPSGIASQIIPFLGSFLGLGGPDASPSLPRAEPAFGGATGPGGKRVDLRANMPITVNVQGEMDQSLAEDTGKQIGGAAYSEMSRMMSGPTAEGL